MNRKIALAEIFILGFLVSIVAGVKVDVARANPYTPNDDYPDYPDTNPPDITVQLPENKASYNLNNTPYSITIKEPSAWLNNSSHGIISRVQFIIDGAENISIYAPTDYPSNSPAHMATLRFDGTLPRLSAGNHSIQVYVLCERFYHDPQMSHDVFGWWKTPPLIKRLECYSNITCFMGVVSFPVVKVLRLENNPGNNTETWLSLFVNEEVSSMPSITKLAYSIDGSSLVYIPVENKTLTGLAGGNHTIEFFAFDIFENMGKSVPTALTIRQSSLIPTPSPSTSPSLSPSPSPTQLPSPESTQTPTSTIDSIVDYPPTPLPEIIAITSIAVVAVACLLFYFRKRK